MVVVIFSLIFLALIYFLNVFLRSYTLFVRAQQSWERRCGVEHAISASVKELVSVSTSVGDFRLRDPTRTAE